VLINPYARRLDTHTVLINPYALRFGTRSRSLGTGRRALHATPRHADVLAIDNRTRRRRQERECNNYDGGGQANHDLLLSEIAEPG
jgi:hypothetical protein